MRKLTLNELGRQSLSDYKQAEKLGITVVLDNIRSAMNVGSIFRTMDGLGLERLILTGITARPPHKEINKTAIGATDSVDWEHIDSVEECVRHLKQEGYTILGIEQTDASIGLDTYEMSADPKIAVVMGNEVKGLSDSILPLLDKAIEIPQYGTKHSFNVAVCAGMVLWELSKQLRR